MAEEVAKKKTGRPKGSKDKKPRTYTVSEKALAQRHKNLGYPTAETDEEKSYNARLIEHVMMINQIAEQADRSDLNSLKSCFVNYLRLCQQDGFSVGNLAAYAAMGFTNIDFHHFSRKNDPQIREFCQFVRQTCAMFRESMVTNSKINPVIGIFWQRNFDGLRNDTEQVQAVQEQEDEYAQFGGTSYKDRYRNLIGSKEKE